MHSLEEACNEAQNLIDNVDLLRGKGDSCTLEAAQLASAGAGAAAGAAAVPGPSWSNGTHNHSVIEPSRKSRVFNIRQRLRELYLEECRNTQPYATAPLPLKNLKRGSRLLEKLVQRDNLNTLIVNLYPGNKGYSLSLRLQGKLPAAAGNQSVRSQGSEPVIETMRWPYSDEELLRCIDNEEIPATLVDLLEANHAELFYQGCVIAEIRDYRLTFPLFSFETHHVLLKPTTQSIINDVNIISSSQDFSAEDRLSLESQIVLATAPPLCLDPNPAVGIMINNLQHKRQRLSTVPLRRTARKFSQVTVNRKRRLDQFTSHNTLKIYDFITRKKAKLRAANAGKQNKKVIDGALPLPPPVPSDETVPLPPPTIKPDVFKFAKHYEKSRETTDCSVHLVEEYILETERGQGRIYRIKLSILQRHSNLEYLGELYVDRDYKEGEKSGASCRFVLGTRVHANRYIQQFTEIFTEEGRKSVRITHVVPGQQHQVSYTPGMRERNAAHTKKSVQSVTVAVHGKQQPTNAVNNTQNTALAPGSTLQNVLTNSQQQQMTGGTTGPAHMDGTQASTINFNLNSQQIQKLQGQLSTGTSILPQSANANSNIQINSVSHLTGLLTNSGVTVPPNVNVHQIQQGQSVIGITGQSMGGNLAQPVQNVNVQSISIGNQNVNSSTIQSLLGSALSTNVLSDDGLTNLTNGPVSTVLTTPQNTAASSTSTVHHPPAQSQIPTTKASRPPISTNPAISALVTSLMNSAQQFQVQQAAQQAANNSNGANASQPAGNNVNQFSTTSNTNQNPTILSLLNATTPLNINNGNVLTTSHVNFNQPNQKILSRKTITNLLNSRLINQNLSAVLNNNVGNQTLVVNNANSQPLRVTLSSLNQLMNVSSQNSISQNQQPQILNIGNVSQIGNSSAAAAAGFTIATTQGNITIATQAANLTTQTFTIANANSQTFTITSPTAVSNQTYALNAPSISTLTGHSPNQTFTITPNSGSLSPQSFTITNSNASLPSAGFTLSPSQNSASQQQTFTVLQPGQNPTNQSFTITAPVGNQSFTVTNAGGPGANQAFALANSNVSPVQANKTFQINSVGTTSQTFTITTPVVTMANQFVGGPGPGSGAQPGPGFSPQSSGQTFAMTASSPSPSNAAANVFTVDSPLPSQVFTVNIPSPSPKSNFSPAFNSSSPSSTPKNYPSQNSVLINKGQTFTINAKNQNFAGVATPVLAKGGTDGSNSVGKSAEGTVTSSSKSAKDCNSNGSNSNNNNNNSTTTGSSNSNGSSSSGSSNTSTSTSSTATTAGAAAAVGAGAGSGGNPMTNSPTGRLNPGRVISCQKRLSNALQQASQSSELNKLLLEKSDIRLLTDANKLINEKSDSVSQTLSENKKLVSENGKLSQALNSNMEVGPSSGGCVGSSSNSNLGLSMPGLSALLAGTPSADNPMPGSSTSSTLLDRLTSSSSSSSSSSTSSAPNNNAGGTFGSPPPPSLPVTPQSPNVSALSPTQNLTFPNNSFSTSPGGGGGGSNSSSGAAAGSATATAAFNSTNAHSPVPSITSPVPNFTSSSPKNQVQFQSSSPNSKDVIGITSPMSSPPGTGPVSLNLQGLSLQGITGLQNVQVSIPGLAVPISLSLNVAGQSGGTQGVIMTSLPVAPTTNTATTSSATSMVLTNSVNPGTGGSSVLSLPVAQFMAPGVKNANQRAATQSSISLAQGSPQSIQLVSSLQKSVVRPSTGQNQAGKTLQPVSPRGLIANAQKNTLKTSVNSGNVVNAGHGNQMLTFAAQQQLQLALQKQAQIQQCYQQNQKSPMSPSSITAKHRRRSNATDSNK